MYPPSALDVLRHFLSSSEVEELRPWATAVQAWSPGRQGTGYEILPLRRAGSVAFSGLVSRALAVLGTPFRDYWDAYLIRYGTGSHVPEHLDVAERGMRHRRLNALLAVAASGGELRIGGERVDLGVGDAVRFFPDREVHAVTRVVGTRLLLSLGAWIEDAEERVDGIAPGDPGVHPG